MSSLEIPKNNDDLKEYIISLYKESLKNPEKKEK